MYIDPISSVLTRYLAKAKVRKEKNLLNGQEDDTNQDEELQVCSNRRQVGCIAKASQTDIIVSHWHTVSFLVIM